MVDQMMMGFLQFDDRYRHCSALHCGSISLFFDFLVLNYGIGQPPACSVG
jgi:hypothetical protein